MKNEIGLTKSKFPPLLSLTYVLQQSADELLAREVGTSLSHVRIMSGLGSAIARSQHELALELQQTEANISRQLQVMKKQGLVGITKNKKDGRQRDVKLTRKGQNKFDSANKLLKKQQSSFLKVLNQGEAEILNFAAQKISKT